MLARGPSGGEVAKAGGGGGGTVQHVCVFLGGGCKVQRRDKKNAVMRVWYQPRFCREVWCGEGRSVRLLKYAVCSTCSMQVCDRAVELPHGATRFSETSALHGQQKPNKLAIPESQPYRLPHFLQHSSIPRGSGWHYCLYTTA